jgi:competence protein ComEA
MRRTRPGLLPAAAILIVICGLARSRASGFVSARLELSTDQRTELLDINTASPQQLEALPGMGAAYAKRVIAGRPYTAKNQLVTRGVLPQSAYEQIKDRSVAHRIVVHRTTPHPAIP